MRRSWQLAFRLGGGGRGSREAVAAAFAAAGAKVKVTLGAWSGNPRDAYAREVTVTGELAPGVAVAGRIGVENTQVPDVPDPEHDDFGTLWPTLVGADALALDAAWGRLAAALEGVGYADETLAAAPRELITHLAECGAALRVAELRRLTTEALVAKAAALPLGWPQSFSYTLPDDWARVLAAVVAPERVDSLALEGCELAAVPEGVLRFPALRWLSLAYNRLPRLGPVPARLPRLERLWLDGNPLGAFDPAELAACRALTVVGLRETGLRELPTLPGVEIQGAVAARR